MLSDLCSPAALVFFLLAPVIPHAVVPRRTAPKRPRG